MNLEQFESRKPDDIFQPLKDKFKGRFSSSLPVVAVLVLLLAITVIKGVFYTIEPNEVGVVLRFGKFVRKTEPGLHVKLPLGVEKVFPVKVNYIYKEEFGFRTKSAGIKSSYQQKSYNEEALMLTGDLNVLDVEWIVQFKIKDPFKAMFHVRNIRSTIRDIAESVMRRFVGDYSFNEVLTSQRLEINNHVHEELQKILDSYGAGVQIITVKLQDVNPPNPVKPAFNEVNAAKQDMNKMVNQAWEVYNKKIPQARGEALKIVKKAEGYALEKINNAEGDAERFTLLRGAYIKAKDVTRKRLYLEKMNEILQNAGKKYIIDPKNQGVIPLLNLKNE